MSFTLPVPSFSRFSHSSLWGCPPIATAPHSYPFPWHCRGYCGCVARSFPRSLSLTVWHPSAAPLGFSFHHLGTLALHSFLPGRCASVLHLPTPTSPLCGCPHWSLSVIYFVLCLFLFISLLSLIFLPPRHFSLNFSLPHTHLVMPVVNPGRRHWDP